MVCGPHACGHRVVVDQLFTLSVTFGRDPSIPEWFREQAPDLEPTARRWWEQMRGCGADVREALHDGCPVACVRDAPFAYVNAFTAHVNVGFFRGAILPDASGLLEGKGKRMRHVKLRPGSEVSSDALRALIDSAYVDIKARLAKS